MQTFVPSKDFSVCAKVLDNKRLNKQHLECFQIINVLEGRSDAWKNHPAVRMWKNNLRALKHYANCIKMECISRGFKSEKIPYYDVDLDKMTLPKWWGDDLVHISHQSNLMRKLPSHYFQFNYTDYGITGYYWPVTPKTKYSRDINMLWISMMSGAHKC